MIWNTNSITIEKEIYYWNIQKKKWHQGKGSYGQLFEVKDKKVIKELNKLFALREL